MPDPETEAGVTEATEVTSESTTEVTEDTQQTTGTTEETSSGSEESFFDPSSLSPELLPAYKQMQGHFTKRMQAIKADQTKLDAYRSFEQNPVGTIRQLAQQYGITIAEATEAAKQEFSPNDWGDVTEHVKKSVLETLQPIFADLQSVKQNSIEQQLDATMPEWRDHEELMTQLLSEHPTLANDPVRLARMAIPESVQQSKAMQAAMRKLEAKAKQSAATKGTEVTQGADTSKPPKNPTFQQAVDWARKKVAAEQG